jgi:hypothetical protein
MARWFSDSSKTINRGGDSPLFHFYKGTLTMKWIILIAIELLIVGCGSDSVTGSFCYEKTLYPNDVYGTGHYAEYREEFERQSGCHSMLNCSAGTAVIEECVDGTFHSK